jgi:hypothetical protein
LIDYITHQQTLYTYQLLHERDSKAAKCKAQQLGLIIANFAPGVSLSHDEIESMIRPDQAEHLAHDNAHRML